MAAAQFSTPAQITSDAEFRTFGSNLSTALASVGMIKTSDTGQINWTTVTKPGSSNASAGYEIWRFADTAQATQPLFIKLEYGTSGSITVLAFWITVGTGTDGAGTITGTRQARQQANKGTGNAATVETYLAAGDGYLTVGVFISPSTPLTPFFFAIERLRTATGDVDTATTTAGFYSTGLAGSSPFFNTYLYDGTVSDAPGASASIPFPILASAVPVASSGAFKGSTYAFPYYPVIGVPRAPARAIAMHYDTNANSAQTFSCPLYGVTHTFRSTGYFATPFGRSSSANSTMALRAE